MNDFYLYARGLFILLSSEFNQKAIQMKFDGTQNYVATKDLKIAVTNLFALGLSVSQANPYLQTISLVLAIGYTSISIYKKLK